MKADRERTENQAAAAAEQPRPETGNQKGGKGGNRKGNKGKGKKQAEAAEPEPKKVYQPKVKV